MKLDHFIKLLLIFGTIHYNIIVADKTCDGDSCKKLTESTATTCDEDGDEPCFFDDGDEEEDASKPVLLRDFNSDGYPVFEKLSRPVNNKVYKFFELQTVLKKQTNLISLRINYN